MNKFNKELRGICQSAAVATDSQRTMRPTVPYARTTEIAFQQAVVPPMSVNFVAEGAAQYSHTD
jgi:hypothetical protein